jgi:hypothetical protein
MIDKDSSLKKSWDAFEGASTYKYAQTAVPIKEKKTEELAK